MPSDFFSYDAPMVEIFGVPHLIFLAVCIVTVTFFILRRDFIKQKSTVIKWIFLGALAFQQIFLLYGWYFFATPVFIEEGLPLQLCRVASALTIVFLLTGNRVALNVQSFFSIYALISLFYPQAVYNFAHISGVSYMINHLITVLIPVFAVIAYDWYPTWRAFAQAVVGFTIYFVIILFVNAFFGGNYFYQVERPFWRDMNSVLFGALTYIVTVVGFAVVNFIALNSRSALKIVQTKRKKSYA